MSSEVDKGDKVGGAKFGRAPMALAQLLCLAIAVTTVGMAAVSRASMAGVDGGLHGVHGVRGGPGAAARVNYRRPGQGGSAGAWGAAEEVEEEERGPARPLVEAKYPVLFNAGLAKCGTTSLVETLWTHPEVYSVACTTECAAKKEPRRFVGDLLPASSSPYPLRPPQELLQRWLDYNTRIVFSEDRAPSPDNHEYPRPAATLPAPGTQVGVDGTLTWTMPFEMGYRLMAAGEDARVLVMGCDRASQAFSWWRFTGYKGFDPMALRAEMRQVHGGNVGGQGAHAPMHVHVQQGHNADPPEARRRWSMHQCAAHELATLWDGAEAPCRPLWDLMEAVDDDSVAHEGHEGHEGGHEVLDARAVAQAYRQCFVGKEMAMAPDGSGRRQYDWEPRKGPCLPAVFEGLRAGPAAVLLEQNVSRHQFVFADRELAWASEDSSRDFWRAVTDLAGIRPFNHTPEVRRSNVIDVKSQAGQSRFFNYFRDMLEETFSFWAGMPAAHIARITDIWRKDARLFCRLLRQAKADLRFVRDCTAA
jgi:hypothetical protein